MSAPKLEKRGKNKGYEPLCRETIQTIQNADSLAIWVLLQSMSDNWVVRKKWIKNQLGIGDIRYAKAVNRLKKLGLWKIEKVRLANGSFCGSKIIIFSELFQVEQNEAAAHRNEGNLKARFTESSTFNHPYDNKNFKEEMSHKKPAELGNHVKINFTERFGFAYPKALTKVADEQRILKIFAREGICESAVARKIIAEWSAMAIRGFQSDDPLSALLWACRNTLAASREGEENLPMWE